MLKKSQIEELYSAGKNEMTLLNLKRCIGLITDDEYEQQADFHATVLATLDVVLNTDPEEFDT